MRTPTVPVKMNLAIIFARPALLKHVNHLRDFTEPTRRPLTYLYRIIVPFLCVPREVFFLKGFPYVVLVLLYVLRAILATYGYAWNILGYAHELHPSSENHVCQKILRITQMCEKASGGNSAVTVDKVSCANCLVAHD